VAPLLVVSLAGLGCGGSEPSEPALPTVPDRPPAVLEWKTYREVGPASADGTKSRFVVGWEHQAEFRSDGTFRYATRSTDDGSAWREVTGMWSSEGPSGVWTLRAGTVGDARTGRIRWTGNMIARGLPQSGRVAPGWMISGFDFDRGEFGDKLHFAMRDSPSGVRR
jgi:hypothetical protein